MYTLKIEHAIRDFDTWKAAFERDPVGRRQGGVRRHRVCRPTNNPQHVLIDLDFDALDQAETFLSALQQLWKRAEVAPVLASESAAGAAAPRAAIVEEVDSQTY
jgi:hypothetical protein